MNVNGMSGFDNHYNLQTLKNNNRQDIDNTKQIENSNLKQLNGISKEDKIKRADEFLVKHDALYAEQMSTVMNTINDGMQTARQIYMRIASGAKVSPEDERNLMQYDYKMYMAAKNAQMMSQRQKDMSKESLIEKFEERHAGDRKDWTTELNQSIQKMRQSDTAAESMDTTSEEVHKSINITI